QASWTKAFQFLFVGKFRTEKNIPLLIKAFAALNHEEARLSIMGNGVMEKELKQLVQELNLVDRVRFLPFDPQPFSIMVQHQCLLLSSHFEGFPNVIMEALCCGVPVISTDCHSGPREIIAPELNFIDQLQKGCYPTSCGYLTTVGDEQSMKEAMIAMLQQQQWAARSDAAKSRALELSQMNAYEQFSQQIDSLLR